MYSPRTHGRSAEKAGRGPRRFVIGPDEQLLLVPAGTRTARHTQRLERQPAEEPVAEERGVRDEDDGPFQERDRKGNA
jgi:hypothetical protein